MFILSNNNIFSFRTLDVKRKSCEDDVFEDCTTSIFKYIIGNAINKI